MAKTTPCTSRPSLLPPRAAHLLLSIATLLAALPADLQAFDSGDPFATDASTSVRSVLSLYIFDCALLPLDRCIIYDR